MRTCANTSNVRDPNDSSEMRTARPRCGGVVVARESGGRCWSRYFVGCRSSRRDVDADVDLFSRRGPHGVGPSGIALDGSQFQVLARCTRRRCSLREWSSRTRRPTPEPVPRARRRAVDDIAARPLTEKACHERRAPLAARVVVAATRPSNPARCVQRQFAGTTGTRRHHRTRAGQEQSKRRGTAGSFMSFTSPPSTVVEEVGPSACARRGGGEWTLTKGAVGGEGARMPGVRRMTRNDAMTIDTGPRTRPTRVELSKGAPTKEEPVPRTSPVHG